MCDNVYVNILINSEKYKNMADSYCPINCVGYSPCLPSPAVPCAPLAQTDYMFYDGTYRPSPVLSVYPKVVSYLRQFFIIS